MGADTLDGFPVSLPTLSPGPNPDPLEGALIGTAILSLSGVGWMMG